MHGVSGDLEAATSDQSTTKGHTGAALPLPSADVYASTRPQSPSGKSYRMIVTLQVGTSRKQDLNSSTSYYFTLNMLGL
jgi:hypothetical protein